MKIKIISILFILIACQNKKYEKNNSVENEKRDAIGVTQHNSLSIKLEDNIVIFENVQTISDPENVSGDFDITSVGNHEVLVKGNFLESDLLDGKKIMFQNGNVSNVRIKFFYAMIFNGDEKQTINLGLTSDTLINLKSNNDKFDVPKFADFRKNMWGKFRNNLTLEKAFEVGKDYFKQNESEEEYLNYLNKIKEFKNDENNIKKLEELSIDIDYTKFEIEFLDNKKRSNKIIFDREFKEKNIMKNGNSTTISSLKMDLNNYKIKKEIKCDLNKDGLEDAILIFEPKTVRIMESDSPLLMDSPLYVLINKGENSYYSINNNNIIYTASYNCPSDGVKKIISKDNYFTIEQVTCDEFGRIQNDNITFVYDNVINKLRLGKFKRSLYERSDGSEFLPISVFLFPKDFGIVDFENYNSKIKYEE